MAIPFLLILASCVQKRSTEVEFYFDLDDKVEAIADDLLMEKAVLKKSVLLNGVEESTEYLPDSDTTWVRELDYFKAANINKTIYRDLYNEEIQSDESSNLTVLTYEHKKPEDASIPWMRLYYLDELDNTRRIEAEYRETNVGFKVSRKLKMEFKDVRGKLQLSSYAIEGEQKNIGQDSLIYSIHGFVIFP